MAPIDTSIPASQVAPRETRPVTALAEVTQPELGIKEIVARSEAMRSETASEMEKLKERLQQAINALNERMRSSQHSLNITVDKASKRFIVTVTDKASGEVIRHIPGESALRVAHNIEALKGILFEVDA